MSDVEKFGASYLEPYSLATRFNLVRDTTCPMVADINTGRFIIGLSTWMNLVKSELMWSVSSSRTSELWSGNPGYNHEKVNRMLTEMARVDFPRWKDVVYYVLKDDYARSQVKATMGLSDDTYLPVEALLYDEKLSRLSQLLEERGVCVESSGLRSSKKNSFYLVTQCPKAHEDVSRIVQDSLDRLGVSVENLQSAPTGDFKYQFDFVSTDMFESEDLGDFVSMAFKEQVPGFMEQKRLRDLLDALRADGLAIIGASVSPEPGMDVSLIVFELDKRYCAGYTLGDLRAKLTAASEKLGYGIPELMDASYGHLIAQFKKTGLQAQRPDDMFYAESEGGDEDYYLKLLNSASARSGKYADVLRLERIVKFLRSKGANVTKAQYKHTLYSRKRLRKLYATYSIDISGARTVDSHFYALNAKDDLVDYLNSVDIKITGDDYFVDPSEAAIFNQISGDKTIVIKLPSLEMEGGESDASDRWETHALESLTPDQEADYYEVATRGYKSKLWLKDLKASLVRNGLSVMSSLKLSYPEGHDAMRLNLYCSQLDSRNQDTDSYTVMSPTAVSTAFFDSLRETGAKLYSGKAKEYEPKFIVKAGGNLYYMVRAYLDPIEPSVNWVNNIEESASEFDEKGITELLNLRAIMTYIGNNCCTVYSGSVRNATKLEKRAIGVEENVPCVRYTVGAYTSSPTRLLSFLASSVNEVSQDIKCNGIDVVEIVPGYQCEGYFYTTSTSGVGIEVEIGDKIPLHSKILRENELPDENTDYEDRSVEAFASGYLSNVPGVSDRARLVSIVKDLESKGVPVLGIYQMPHVTSIRAGESVVTGGISLIKRNSIESYEYNTAVMDVMTRYEAVDCRYAYTTLDNKHVVYNFWFYSHDNCKDIVDLSLTHGAWNEGRAKGFDLKSEDLLEESRFMRLGPPVDEGQDDDLIRIGMAGALSGIEEEVKIRKIAFFMKNRGWKGIVMLSSPSSLSVGARLTIVGYRTGLEADEVKAKKTLECDIEEADNELLFIRGRRLSHAFIPFKYHDQNVEAANRMTYEYAPESYESLNKQFGRGRRQNIIVSIGDAEQMTHEGLSARKLREKLAKN